MTRATSIGPFWILLFPLVIAIPLSLWSIRYRKKRTREFAEMAQQIGFAFLGETWRGPALSAADKTCIVQRTRGGFRNVMTGPFGGLDVTVFDYVYQAGKSTMTLTLAAFAHDRQLPPFELRSENLVDKINEAFAHNDIDFDSNPQFSKRYFLRSPDEQGSRRLFTPGLLAYFEQIPPDKQWHIESSARSLIVYRYRQVRNAAEIPDFLNEASAIARTILDSTPRA